MSTTRKNTLVDVLKFSAVSFALLLVILVVSKFLPLNNLGIRPRETNGLLGILFSPFLHADFNHLWANVSALLILGWILYGLEGARTLGILFSIMLFGGLGTWLIGRGGSIHIGASGVVYGVFGYIVAAGLFRKNFVSVLAGLLVFLFYGGLLWGVLPIVKGVSWEGHLCGLLAGMGDARVRCVDREKAAGIAA